MSDRNGEISGAVILGTVVVGVAYGLFLFRQHIANRFSILLNGESIETVKSNNKEISVSESDNEESPEEGPAVRSYPEISDNDESLLESPDSNNNEALLLESDTESNVDISAFKNISPKPKKQYA